MTQKDGYPIPAKRTRYTEEIRGSRFVSTVDKVDFAEEAKAFINAIRQEFSDASHNCWAYLIGEPGSSASVGMSDDGEPHNSAGRPMLDVLLHSGVGDVAAVVTRYFGGTKLGRGGLVRAYSGGVKGAMAGLPIAYRIEYKRLHLTFAYPFLEGCRRIASESEAELENEEFGSEVEMILCLPEGRLEDFRRSLEDLTRGQIVIKEREDQGN